MATVLCVNQPNVIHEIFDDEVVILNLASGNYYSLTEAGTHIWRLVENRATEEAIIGQITQMYTGDRAEISQAVAELISELQQEELISNTDEQPGQPLELEAPDQENQPVFTAPTLQKYTDMQELLLLDPIHEVDEMGWPSSRAETPTPEDR